MITIDLPSSPHPSHAAPSKPTLTRFLNRARAAIGLPGTIDVLLTSDAELKRLNRTFRGKNKPTDVLSFPADPISGLPPEATHAGDLAISVDTAARQAAHFGHSLDLELRILLLHGLLHLAGHDHETDSGEMAALETQLRTILKLPTGLIDRTLAKPRTSVPTKLIPPSQAKQSLSSRPKRIGAPSERSLLVGVKSEVEGPASPSRAGKRTTAVKKIRAAQKSRPKAPTFRGPR
jgi:probable rRNA maturation factor